MDRATCMLCGQITAKKLRGKSNCKTVCGGCTAHRECLELYCVLCCTDVEKRIYKVCQSCDARIHIECSERESRRPPELKTKHNWATPVQKAKEFTDEEELGVDLSPYGLMHGCYDPPEHTLADFIKPPSSSTKHKKKH